MNNVMPFINKEDIHEQACVWISRIDRGLNELETQQLCTWAQANQSNKKALFEMAELWDDMSALNELSALFPLKAGSSEKTERRVWSPPVRWSIAASFASAIVIASSWLFSQSLHHQGIAVAQHSHYHETGIGEQRPVTLQDGSVVHLNTNTVVSVDFNGTSRNINLLRGEAHFDVAHNPDRPFIVSAAGKEVTAIGTAFNVEIFEQSSIEVLVTEGKVLVEATENEQTDVVSSPSDSLHTFMIAGDKAEFSDVTAAEKTRLSLDQVQKDLAWQQGMLVFQGESLSEVLLEVSRYTQAEFEVLDDDIKQTRVAGYFKVGDTQGLLRALKNNFAISSVQLGSDRYALSADS